MALEGIEARSLVEEPERIEEISVEKLTKYTEWIEDLVRSMIGDAFFRVVKSHEDWDWMVQYLIRTVYLQGVKDGTASFERYLTDQAKAQTRGLFNGLFRAVEEGQ